MAFIPDLLRSIYAQTFTDFSVLLIDNGSVDGVEAYVREHYPQVTLLRNARNLGFSPAHNQAARYAMEKWDPGTLSDRFILATNPDVIMTPTFLETLMKAADAHPEAGSFGGKLLRAYTENGGDEALKETVRSERIDSTALAAHRNRTVTDRGAGELDAGQYDVEEAVFGVTAALSLYRASALQDVRYRDEFFDQDFYLYKEDVDLAWRLRTQGWDAWYIPTAVAYHYRGAYGKEKMGWFERIRNRRGKSMMRNYYSTRNHWLMIWKNERICNILLALPWILAFEIRRFIYVLLLETRNIGAFPAAFALLPKMFAKRNYHLARKRTTAKEMRRWFR